jgi:hypothetical protein
MRLLAGIPSEYPRDGQFCALNEDKFFLSIYLHFIHISAAIRS